MSDSKASPDDLRAHVLVVREGHGANCSSIGSVIDTLFATAAVGGALLAAVAAAAREESQDAVGPRAGAGAVTAVGVGVGAGAGAGAGVEGQK